MRLLLVRVGAMGDVLHGLPAATALRQALPGVTLGWCVEPRWRALLESADGHRPVIDQTHLAETRQWSAAPASPATLASLRRLRSELQAARYDAVVDLQGSIRSGVLGWLSGTRRRIGLADPRERPARWLYRERILVRSTHVVEQAAELVGHAAGLPLQPVRPELPVCPQSESWAASLTCGEPCVLLAPQAGWGAKQWPADRFAALAVVLRAQGWRVLVNAAGPADAVAVAVVAQSHGSAEPVTSTLAQLVALTRRMHLVVAGDTGPLHLAATLGRPVVALFGPTNPARTGPWGAPAAVLRHASSTTDHRRHSGTEAGLAEITLEEVVQACNRMLENRGMPSSHTDDSLRPPAAQA